MSLREDMWKYEQITGESAEHVPIIKLGAFLDGYEMGVKALEQTELNPSYNGVKTELESCDTPRTNLAETSQDTISREALRQKLQDYHDFFVNAYGNFKGMSLSDKARVDEIDNCIAMVVNAPSVTPKQKATGSWVEKQVVDNEEVEIEQWQSARCSKCDKYHTTPYSYYFDDYNYCPNCGAKMEVEE